MALSTRIVETDSAGLGTVTVAPCFYAGSDGAAGTILNETTDIGIAKLTAGSMKVVAGDVIVHGAAATEYSLYFDFTL